MGAGLASRKVTRGVGEQLLDEQIVRHRVTEEDGHVDGVVVERPRVRLVVQEGRTANVKNLERQPECIRQCRICTEMRDAVREANQRIVPSRRGVDALGISGRQPVKNFHLGTHQPIPFRMGEPHRASHALARNRVDHVLFDCGDHCLEMFLEMCTQRVELRCISNELRWSSSPRFVSWPSSFPSSPSLAINLMAVMLGRNSTPRLWSSRSLRDL